MSLKICQLLNILFFIVVSISAATAQNSHEHQIPNSISGNDSSYFHSNKELTNDSLYENILSGINNLLHKTNQENEIDQEHRQRIINVLEFQKHAFRRAIQIDSLLLETIRQNQNSSKFVDYSTFAALLISILTLIIVLYQTNLSRKSLEFSHESVNLMIKARYLEMLPKAGFVLTVKTRLEEWLNDLNTMKTKINQYLLAPNNQKLQELSKLGRSSPRGLVTKFSDGSCPAWVSQIWIAGAQYYYNSACMFPNLWDNDSNKPRHQVDTTCIDRIDKSIHGIEELLKIILNVLPDSYLNSPAAISDNDFY